MDVTSPSTQLLGMLGQLGSTWKVGALPPPGCWAAVAATSQAARTARVIAASIHGRRLMVNMLRSQNIVHIVDSPGILTMLASGERLGPYEIQSVLGAGGMGQVYRARDTKLNRE